MRTVCISIFLSALLCSCATTPSVLNEAKAIWIAKKTFYEILPTADSETFDWEASREYNKWCVRASSKDGGDSYQFDLRVNGEPVVFVGPGLSKRFYLVKDPFLPSSLSQEDVIKAAKEQLFRCFPHYREMTLLWKANRSWNAWALRFDQLGGFTSAGEPALVMESFVYLTLALDGKLVSMRTHWKTYSQKDLEELAARNELQNKDGDPRSP